MPEGEARSEPIGRVPAFFEGVYQGSTQLKRRDGSLLTDRDGAPLLAVRLLMGEGQYQQVYQVTCPERIIPGDLPTGTMLRVRGSASANKRGDRSYFSVWGDAAWVVDIGQPVESASNGRAKVAA